jgi:dUTP pyrophosphatase
MKIKIKRFDLTLPLPEYKTAGAAAFDLVARETVTIEPQQVVLVPLNIAIQLPADHWALLTARSSLFKKKVLLANGVGVGDTDYCGDNDEYKAPLLNFSNEIVTIEKGERIVQMMILSRERVEFEAVEHLDEKDRGGFGSTGFKN